MIDMKVRDLLRQLHPSRSVVITDMEEFPVEEGPAGGLLDESGYLDSPAVYHEDGFPYLIMAGQAV